MSGNTPRLWNNRWSAFACHDKWPTFLPGGDTVLQLLHFRQLSSDVCLLHKKANKFLLPFFFLLLENWVIWFMFTYDWGYVFYKWTPPPTDFTRSLGWLRVSVLGALGLNGWIKMLLLLKSTFISFILNVVAMRFFLKKWPHQSGVQW